MKEKYFARIINVCVTAHCIVFIDTHLFISLCHIPTIDLRILIVKLCSLDYRYPEVWYQDVTSDRYYSLAAVNPHDGQILGIIVCDVKTYKRVNLEVS